MSARFPSRSSAIAARHLGGEMVIMSVADSKLFTLNEVATFIWEAADGRTSLEQIAARLCEEFEVTPEAARRDAERFVDELAAHGVLRVSEHPGQGPAAEEAP